MDKKKIIQKTADYAKKTLEGEESGHDWWHAYRVWKMAKYLGKKEKNADMFVVELAALLHDIADWKFNAGNEEIGPKTARKWLENLNVEEKYIEHVCQIIKDAIFKGANVKWQMKTREGMIVQDADKLDAIGAIGIARTFAYGGYKNAPIHNPNLKPIMYNSFEEYKSNTPPTIAHFYEKLLLLKDRMNTKTAREIARGRHKYMEKFLKKFYKEWEGKE
ncbi:MAG: HD domain-containing protein [Patescibacteria group bacterium]|nr:HD domain-containing protein [Patescibacteria group bacterium]